MTKKLLEIAADIVKTQVRLKSMTSAEIATSLRMVFQTLREMQNAEETALAPRQITERRGRLMLGQGYFEDRLGDIFHLSPIKYICGQGALSCDHLTLKVEWELNVSITGEPVFVIHPEKIIPESAKINDQRRFVEWSLKGTTDHGSLVTSSGIIIHRFQFSSENATGTYFCNFRQFEIAQKPGAIPDKLVGVIRNLDFFGLEFTSSDAHNERNKFGSSG